MTLTVEKPRYATGDTIVVTIHNGLAQTIWATDHQTDCTVVTAERLLESQWVAVGGCPLMTPTRVVPVADASATVRQSLNTGASTGVGPGAVAGSSWPSGTYRVTLIYTGGDDGTGGPGGVAHSATFTIG